MTLNQLEQFMAVVRVMSISRAAEELYVSHSSISRNISLLEDELHTILINRDNKVSSLTKAGALLAERAEFILQYIDDTKRDVCAVGTTVKTSLRVISCGFEDPRVLKLFSDLRKMYPSVQITVEALDGLNVIKKLLAKEADIVFTFSFTLPDVIDPNIRAIKLYEDEFVALVSNHSPISLMDTLDVENLQCAAPLHLRNARFDFVAGIAKANSFIDSEQDVLGCNTMEEMLTQLKYSGGWAIIPRFIAQRNQASCKIIPLKNAVSTYAVMVCWNKQNTNPLIQSFLDNAGVVFDHKEPF